MPFRNQLVVAGDFNSSLIRDSNPDDASFRQLVRHHHLGSMLQSRPTQPTYFAPQGNTQIDYLLSRQCQLDAQAKEGWVELDCPLGGWRTALDHRPLIASYPKQWQPWRRKPSAIVNAMRLREHLSHLKTHSPEEWQNVCTRIGTQIQSLPSTVETIENLHTYVIPHIRSRSSQ